MEYPPVLYAMDQGEHSKRFHAPNKSFLSNESLPLLIPRIMAEKRRPGVPAAMLETKSTKTDSEREFLSQVGVGELLRGALLKMVEARSDDPIGVLADHFCNVASESENGTAGYSDGEQRITLTAGVQEQQHLNKALWHLKLAHHSQRSAFSNNVRVAYDLLTQTGPQRYREQLCGGPGGRSSNRPTGGGVRGGLYTQTLQCLCSEGGVPASTSAPLLRRLHCQNHEAVPYDVFGQGVLTCAVFCDYIRRVQRLYAEVCGPAEGPAGRALCLAVLGTLQEALETSQGCDTNANANTKANSYLEANAKANRYLEASAKISPCKLAQAMAEAHTAGEASGVNMDAKEFEDAAAELFITRVRVIS